MDVYRTDRIRNVVLLGHGGSGKTTLAEAMAYLAGMTNRLGRVEDGNTVSDFDKEEIKRHFSVSTTLIPVPWDKVKVNVLDTPGYFDFVGEVEEAVSAADAAIIVVSGKAGVQVGTQKAWNLCEKYKLPRMFFVTDMDVDDVSYRKVVEELTELYGKKIAPLHFPIREDGKFVGYVNVVKQAGRKYIDKAGKEPCDVPEYLDEYLEKYHDILMESVAETSEEFMDRYFEGDEFSVTEVSAALATNVQDASIVPVCMGSPINLRGVSNLLDDICGYFPSPDKRSCNGISQKTNEIFEANYDFAKTKSAYVWKTIADPFLGKYSLIKVASGVIIKTAIYAQCMLELLGKNPVPRYCDDHNDIVTCFDAGTADALIGFCQGIQAASPVDSYAAPEPSPEPGYTDEVVMASGSFTQGSTIELSCDGPLREPYTCYLQGGLNFAASRAGVLLAIQKAYFKD